MKLLCLCQRSPKEYESMKFSMPSVKSSLRVENRKLEFGAKTEFGLRD